MDTNVNYTIVGIFVITLIAFIVLGVIWLSSGFSIGKMAYYEIYMKESVAGLSVDSVVEFNGVNVGSVKKIEIDPKDPRLVYVLLSINKTTPVSQGTKATLNTKGLTGIAYVALEDDGSNLKPLVKLPNEPYLIINTAPSFFWRLDTGMKKLNENVTKVAKSLESLLSEENLESIREILIDIRHVSRTFANNTTQIDEILHNTAKASGQFLPFMQNSEEMLRTINAQILPAATKAMLNLDAITNNLSAVSRDVKENPAIFIRGRTEAPLGPGEK